MAKSSEKQSRVDTLETTVAGLQRDIAHISSSLDNLAALVRAQSRPQWSTYASWAAIVLGIVAAIGTLSLEPLRDGQSAIDTRLGRMEREGAMSVQAELRGLKDDHAETKDDVRRDVAGLDETLHREMRILDTRIEQKVAGLDKLLQREMRLLNDRMGDQVDAARQEVRALRSWQARHDTDVSGRNADQDARIRTLERRVTGGMNEP